MDRRTRKAPHLCPCCDHRWSAHDSEGCTGEYRTPSGRARPCWCFHVAAKLPAGVDVPFTPKMRLACEWLAAAWTVLDPVLSEISALTKQRLAKWGLVVYRPGVDWDGPVQLTPRGSSRLRAK